MASWLRRGILLGGLLVAAAAGTAASADGGIFGDTITRSELVSRLLAAGIPATRLPYVDGTHYTLVRRSQVPSLLSLARRRLSRDFGSRWDVRFNCLGFATNLVNEASKELAREDWRDPVPTGANADAISIRPAVLRIAYVPEQDPRYGHAVNLLLTDAGPVWVDPQSGIVHLSDHELASVYYPDA